MQQSLKGKLAVAISCLVIGILLMFQFRVQQSAGKVTAERAEDLVPTLIQIDKARELLSAEAEELRRQLQQFQEGENFTKVIQEQLQEARLKAGMVAVEGPGLIVNLNDSQLPFTSDVGDGDRNVYFIHEEYLRKIVNAFWTGGAEAISINGQRVIATTEIFCGGTTIFINNKSVSPPFEIKAIGNPNDLTSSIKLDIIQYKKLQNEYGILVDFVSANYIQIPGYTGQTNFKYLKPAAETLSGKV